MLSSTELHDVLMVVGNEEGDNYTVINAKAGVKKVGVLECLSQLLLQLNEILLELVKESRESRKTTTWP